MTEIELVLQQSQECIGQSFRIIVKEGPSDQLALEPASQLQFPEGLRELGTDPLSEKKLAGGGRRGGRRAAGRA